MPQGDGDTGLIDIDTSLNPSGNTMNAVDIGQAYYNMYNSPIYGNYAPGDPGESAIFWWDVMQEYLPQNDIQFDQWMYNYG